MWELLEAEAAEKDRAAREDARRAKKKMKRAAAAARQQEEEEQARAAALDCAASGGAGALETLNPADAPLPEAANGGADGGAEATAPAGLPSRARGAGSGPEALVPTANGHAGGRAAAGLAAGGDGPGGGVRNGLPSRAHSAGKGSKPLVSRAGASARGDEPSASPSAPQLAGMPADPNPNPWRQPSQAPAAARSGRPQANGGGAAPKPHRTLPRVSQAAPAERPAPAAPLAGPSWTTVGVRRGAAKGAAAGAVTTAAASPAAGRESAGAGHEPAPAAARAPVQNDAGRLAEVCGEASGPDGAATGVARVGDPGAEVRVRPGGGSGRALAAAQSAVAGMLRAALDNPRPNPGPGVQAGPPPWGHGSEGVSAPAHPPGYSGEASGSVHAAAAPTPKLPAAAAAGQGAVPAPAWGGAMAAARSAAAMAAASAAVAAGPSESHEAAAPVQDGNAGSAAARAVQVDRDTSPAWGLGSELGLAGRAPVEGTTLDPWAGPATLPQRALHPTLGFFQAQPRAPAAGGGGKAAAPDQAPPAPELLSLGASSLSSRDSDDSRPGLLGSGLDKALDAQPAPAPACSGRPHGAGESRDAGAAKPPAGAPLQAPKSALVQPPPPPQPPGSGPANGAAWDSGGSSEDPSLASGLGLGLSDSPPASACSRDSPLHGARDAGAAVEALVLDPGLGFSLAPWDAPPGSSPWDTAASQRAASAGGSGARGSRLNPDAAPWRATGEPCPNPSPASTAACAPGAPLVPASLGGGAGRPAGLPTLGGSIWGSAGLGLGLQHAGGPAYGLGGPGAAAAAAAWATPAAGTQPLAHDLNLSPALGPCLGEDERPGCLASVVQYLLADDTGEAGAAILLSAAPSADPRILDSSCVSAAASSFSSRGSGGGWAEAAALLRQGSLKAPSALQGFGVASGQDGHTGAAAELGLGSGFWQGGPGLPSAGLGLGRAGGWEGLAGPLLASSGGLGSMGHDAELSGTLPYPTPTSGERGSVWAESTAASSGIPAGRGMMAQQLQLGAEPRQAWRARECMQFNVPSPWLAAWSAHPPRE